ncbi:SDR family oxidoreductase [Microbacterium sp. LMC-P-041]|uniref:SDR family oxidoreductase n=2 Tax=unclassified Microbacterium TaxID=2609290 RepID=UPI002552185E|nr:SDR family oxidoreductase [Microbacterium sp. LMC-P-041]
MTVAEQSQSKEHEMKIVVFGGTGRIGSQVVDLLREEGHEVVVAAVPEVDALKGTGIAAALAGADVAVDVTNAMIFDEEEIVSFFTTTSRNILQGEIMAGVGRHVVLSIVGVDRMNATSYLAGKVAQERTVAEGGVPYTIVRATQFQEFLPGIADMSTVDGVVRVPPILLQPTAAIDVARTVADVAVHDPGTTVVEVAGPERARMSEFIEEALRRADDERTVVEDPEALYSGVFLPEDGLVPVGDARIGEISFNLRGQS